MISTQWQEPYDKITSKEQNLTTNDQ